MMLTRPRLTLLALAAAASFPAAAQSNAEVLNELKALRERVNQLEQQLKESQAKPAAAPATPQWGMTPEQAAELNRLTVKVEAMEDARDEGGFGGLKISGQMQAAYIYNRAQDLAGFQFLDSVAEYGYNYWNSYIGMAILDFQKEMQDGTRWRLTLAPQRGVGSVIDGYSIVQEASVSVPLTDLQTRFIAGQIPDWSGYEYLQPTLNKLITHNLLFDFTLPTGYIGALFGIECSSGDTFISPGINLTMTSMFVPDPVISLAITPKDNKAQINMSKALNRFTKEDPTFRTHLDQETGETIIEGMGELHLEVYVERMKREYSAEVATGNPRVAYRETITQRADFNYIHKKQTGGAGQYGRVAGYIEPVADADFVFENAVTGGNIPTQYIPAVEKGFRQCLAKGPKMEFPVTGVRIVINDGASHAVDSSDMAFQAAARGAFKDGYLRARPVIHEPIMKVVVETPTEFQGAVMGLLNQRRGMIVGAQDEGPMCVVESQVPLAEMFGFSTVLRSATQGKAQFTMEFALYRQVPQSISEKIAEEAAQRKKSAA